MNKPERHVFVCTNTRPPDHPKGSCGALGGAEVRERLKATLQERGLRARVRSTTSGCLDQCAKGCVLVVYPEGVWYGGVTPSDVQAIVDEHLVGGTPVTRLRIDQE